MVDPAAGGKDDGELFSREEFQKRKNVLEVGILTPQCKCV